MAKIVLGKRPEFFTRIIKVKMLDGAEGQIECKYRYRTKTEFGAFIDELSKASDTPITQDADGEVKFSLEDMLAKTADSNAEYIMKVLAGWNLDAEFTLESVRQLCDELPGVAGEIIGAYRTACVEGRLGN